MSSVAAIGKLGRLELLRFVNDFLGTDYDKIENLKDGSAFAQIMDATYPVNAYTEDDCIRNFKIIDQAFRTCGVQKEIPFKKIASGNFQENLEFLQWCLQHMQRINPKAREQYLAFDRRDEAQEQRARRIATASAVAGTPRNARDIRMPSSAMHRGSRADSEEEPMFFAGDVHSQRPTTVPARRLSVQHGWLSGGGDGRDFMTSSTSMLMEPPATPSANALLMMQADQVDNEQTWLRKRDELEELMVSLQSDLQYRLQAQQETVDALLAFKRERDFYLAKVLALEKLCARHKGRNSLLVAEVERVLLESSPLDQAESSPTFTSAQPANLAVPPISRSPEPVRRQAKSSQARAGSEDDERRREEQARFRPQPRQPANRY